MAPAVGSKVPAFRLIRAHQDVVESGELFAAGPTVIHFFPFAFTGNQAEGKGCEAQVCGFGARLDAFKELGVQVIAVSHDSPFSLKVWREQLEQDYPFMSDYEWSAAKAFGVLLDEAFDTYRPLNTRAAFLVDTDGTVRYAWVADSLSTLPPVDEVLEAARQLAA